MSEADAVRAAAAAIVDGQTVDWNAAEASARTPADRDLLEHLRLIASVAPARPRSEPDGGLPLGETPGLLYRAILLIAWIKTALSVLVAIFAIVTSQPNAKALWPPLVNQSVFVTCAIVLAIGGARDLRARRLGDFLLLAASAFSDRVLLTLAGSSRFGGAVAVLRHMSTDAFLAFGLWLFVWCFPAAPRHRTDRVMSQRALRVALAVAAVLFVANAIPPFDTPSVPHRYLTAIAVAFDRHTPAHSYYWPVLFIVTAGALPYLLWKSRREAIDERRRIATFAMAFVVCVTPMLLAVVVSPYMPFFDDPVRREFVGLFLYASLLSIVPMIAYAVVIDRVMDLQLIITAAMRHAAVRYTLWLAGIAPLCLLVVYIYANRHLTVSELMSRSTIAVLPLPLIGLLALTFRAQLLQAIDRRLLCEAPNVPEVLTSLERSLREPHGVRDVIAILTREVDRALHMQTVAVLVVDERGRGLSSPAGAVSPLRLDSVLGTLIGLTREEVDVGLEASGPVLRLLPDEDRQWLARHRFQLLVPLMGSGGRPLGVIALGEKRSGLRFSKVDRLLLTSMATHGAMAIENRSPRDVRFRYLAGRAWQGIDWDQEPAALCPRCQLVRPAQTTTCECGSLTTSAALPLIVSGKFRLERLIGSGGMSVVYLATDIALNRKVALKTMPHLKPLRAMRLYREARAMASVLHPNLAMIFGIESWRGSPLLIVEYVDGGTLNDRIRLDGGKLALSEALGLGIVLADVLDRVHGSGVLHRDIKPTNIGYTRDLVPKLMDFGVAYMLEASELYIDARSVVPFASAISAVGTDVAPLTLSDHIIGTPLYLSPEAIAGADADPSFDLWSLNLTLYEAIAGRNPFRRDTVFEVFDLIRGDTISDIREFAPDCPIAVARFFARALSRDLAHRPPSAAALRNRLRELLAIV